MELNPRTESEADIRWIYFELKMQSNTQGTCMEKAISGWRKMEKAGQKVLWSLRLVL